MRENTEGLYCGRERRSPDGAVAVTERVITRAGSERVLRFAFERARAEGRGRVTVVHKANVLRQTCGLFLEVAREVAADYPEIGCDEMLVDTCAMRLIRAPETFDVICTTNLFGDILSDAAAELVGGLGLARSANIGDTAAVFEPVHGSAPDLVGTGLANPLATFAAIVELLGYLGEQEAASRLEAALEATLAEGSTTPDLGGSATAAEVTRRVGELLDSGARGSAEEKRGSATEG